MLIIFIATVAISIIIASVGIYAILAIAQEVLQIKDGYLTIKIKVNPTPELSKSGKALVIGLNAYIKA